MVVTMRLVVAAVLLAAVAASVVHDELKNIVITKEPMKNMDMKSKEMCILKLMNHILQPTMYEDVREVAKAWVLEENEDKYMKMEAVKEFINTYKMGMLPRGEVFVHMDHKHVEEAVKVFKLLYFANDFDVFLKTACWLRERINGGMFVYALTAAIFHRSDCSGIKIPAPYEIYPYLFVDSNILHKAFMMKMSKAAMDPVMKNYYGIKVKDNSMVIIDWRKGLRHTMSEFDRTSYFTEDIDLNTYLYYMHMSYPYWMNEDMYRVNKERRGEAMWYGYQQLQARLRLERLSHHMCDLKPLDLDGTLDEGYWPKILLHTGDEMPVRYNKMKLTNENNIKYRLLLEDNKRLIRDGIKKGHMAMHDGTTVSLKKPDDIENLCRIVLGGFVSKDDHKGKSSIWRNLAKTMLSYGTYNMGKYTYIPTAADMYSTALRDPGMWKMLKLISEYFIMFKEMLPKYTREELDFPGVKIEQVTTDKLVTFMDEYDVDITNAVYLDHDEMQKHRSDMMYVARMHRLNHQPFKITIDVASDKAVECVVRVFLGPKLDCMGRFTSVNDKRNDMVEIDSFLYKLETGKNTIVRDSLEMNNVIKERPWSRNNWAMDPSGGQKAQDNWWYKSRIGFPHRLLLPMGSHGGMPYQMFVIVTPVRAGMSLPSIDMNTAKERKACRWTVCMDTMPLGFPFDRPIDETNFYTKNMKFHDVMVYTKDLAMSNMVKDVDMSEMVMKRDDLTYLDKDMLVKRSYKSVMMMSGDDMTHM
uniref:basic juvenile hormone-suppressible protein 1 n=1 Tax=Galleria mellonella TaxID=7137 RepID=UPI000EF8BFCD|nr:Chain A, basic juvenile hormone-suppressible protein 1 [Galleria mellonella]8CAN_B Chain B, basic juvenile hormone-suppressible protein 1 [Galleria mellonella]8CAN_C Chain C, basic juvenile hormone-suppressible protein 1 [Galleria mellonella]8CAN_D Chain D, basic juvenile hormone-suppressible protein 1 [Galleria mellonella]8CAN_E Chain E, basic juvenile hormone-suppressible protein 1 [Galleria mellonella]8CAN_F Chain F, basic juvenile hormone-suppressible protein 1 [Galleria mellonella]